MTDDDLNELETELRRLRPRSISPRLQAGMEQALSGRETLRLVDDLDAAAESPVVSADRTPGEGLPLRDWVRWALPLAAAFVFGVLAVRLPPTAPDTVRPAEAPARPEPSFPMMYQPVSAEKMAYGSRQDTLVTLPDGTPARRLSSHYVDTITWRDPRTNASLQWSVPREEIRVIPIRTY